MAFAVSKRAGNAVVRNRIRRRLRAAVSDRRDDLVPGAAYVLGGASEVATMTYLDLCDTVGSLLERTRSDR